MKNTSHRLAVWAGVVGVILLIPLFFTIRDGGVEGVGWNWTLFDFVWMGILLFGAALVYELVIKKMGSGMYRAAGALAVATSVLLVWINGAVGIIGNDTGANLLYFGVLVIGAIGAIVAHFQPRGMASALFAMACAHALVPVIVLLIWKPDITVDIFGVVMLNAFFVMLFVASGFLFRRAAGKK
ncbi:MAG: hypothetical protein AB197_00170 [Parcubacteria bacterium C7867-002]|nr:MAG: hypothetical protein AB197_00170 [Parcubacteria bacterium C7867-002]